MLWQIQLQSGGNMPGVNETGRRIALILAFAMLSSFVASATAFAQSGSTGGTIGKQDKSISGGDDPVVSPHAAPASKPTSKPPGSAGPASQNGPPQAPKCSNIVGVWHSWASAVFGKSDTTFDRNGTWSHRSGQGGKWWCDGGQIILSKTGESGTAAYRFSPDAKQMIMISSGSVIFGRD